MNIDNPYKRNHSHPQVSKPISRFGNNDNSNKTSNMNDDSTSYHQKTKSPNITSRHSFYLVFIIIVAVTFYLHTQSEVHVMNIEKIIKNDFKLRGSSTKYIQIDKDKMKNSYNDFFVSETKEEVGDGSESKYDDGLHGSNSNKEKNSEQEMTDEYDMRGHIISNKKEHTSKIIRKKPDILKEMNEHSKEDSHVSSTDPVKLMKMTDVGTQDGVTHPPHKIIIATTLPIQLVPPLSVNITTNLLTDNNNNKNNINNDIKPSLTLPIAEIDDTAKILRDHDLHNKEKYTKNSNEVHVEDRKSKENRIMNLNMNSKVSNDKNLEEQSNVGNSDKDMIIRNDGKERLNVNEEKSQKDETVLRGVDTIKEEVGTIIEEVGTVKDEVGTIKEEVDTVKEGVDTVNIRGQMQDREEESSIIKEEVDIDTKKEEGDTKKEEIDTVKEKGEILVLRGQRQERIVAKNDIGENESVGEEKKGGDKENTLIANNNLPETAKDGVDTVNIIQERSVGKNEIGESKSAGVETGGDKENNSIANDLPILGLTPMAGLTVRGEGINNAEKDTNVVNFNENNGVQVGSDRCAIEVDPFLGTGPVEVLIYFFIH
jgi:hypothetical protein